jgi:hypothetical protein
MDKIIKKTKQEIDKKMDKLLRQDKIRDKACEKAESMEKKKK